MGRPAGTRCAERAGGAKRQGPRDPCEIHAALSDLASLRRLYGMDLSHLGIAALSLLPACTDVGLVKTEDIVGAPFMFSWTAPLEGDLVLEGELTTLDGVPVRSWSALATAHGSSVQAQVEVCGSLAFRGGGSFTTGNSELTTWTCVRTSTDDAPDDFTLVGEVRFALDGVDLPVETTTAPTSTGARSAPGSDPPGDHCDAGLGALERRPG